jgi:hypothetical protein
MRDNRENTVNEIKAERWLRRVGVMNEQNMK